MVPSQCLETTATPSSRSHDASERPSRPRVGPDAARNRNRDHPAPSLIETSPADTSKRGDHTLYRAQAARTH